MPKSENIIDYKTKFKNICLQKGSFAGLAEHEILEFLLYKCNCAKNAEQIAKGLLNEFGSLQGVVEADTHELLNTKLLKERTVETFKMLIAICGYITEHHFPKIISCYDINTAKAYIKTIFNGSKVEKTVFFHVDSGLNIVGYSIEAVGNSQKIMLDFPKIAKNALNKKCSYLIMAHNHPQAPALPSDADILTTKDYIAKFKALEITLLDHFIVGQDGVNSMRLLGCFRDYD